MTPHVHANVIKAGADGAEIEYYSSSLAKWILLPTPIGWYPYNEYRIKPQPNLTLFCG